MKKYVEVFGAVSPSVNGAKRATDIVAALAPPSGSHALVPARRNTILGAEVSGMLPGVVGAVAGALVWKRHPVLGVLAGHAIGANAKELLSGDRKKAMCHVAVEGAGILGALKYKKHPVLGWVGGTVAGAVATSFVSGSPASEAWKKLKGR
jgi:hypothetical protein